MPEEGGQHDEAADQGHEDQRVPPSIRRLLDQREHRSTEAERGADYSIPHKVDDSLAVDVTGWEEVHSEDASTNEHHEHIDSATGLESRMAVSDPEPQPEPEPKPEPPKRRTTRARVEQKSDDELVLEGLRNRLTDLARNAPLSRLERAARAVAGDDFNDDYQALSEAQLREVIALMEKK